MMKVFPPKTYDSLVYKSIDIIQYKHYKLPTA